MTTKQLLERMIAWHRGQLPKSTKNESSHCVPYCHDSGKDSAHLDSIAELERVMVEKEPWRYNPLAD